MSSYKTTLINHQEWMTENLDVSNFNNGDPIPYAKSEDEWIKAAQTHSPAWCYPIGNNHAPIFNEGKLYNKFAINDPRGLAPEGFMIPTVKNYVELVESLGGHKLTAIGLKSTYGWKNIDLDYSGKLISGCGTNKFNFNIVPISYRDEKGEFHDFNDEQCYWVMEDYPDEKVIIYDPIKESTCGISYKFSVGNFNVRFQEDHSMMSCDSRGAGFPVRCKKVLENHDNWSVSEKLESCEDRERNFWRLTENYFRILELYGKSIDAFVAELRELSIPVEKEGLL